MWSASMLKVGSCLSVVIQTLHNWYARLLQARNNDVTNGQMQVCFRSLAKGVERKVRNSNAKIGKRGDFLNNYYSVSDWFSLSHHVKPAAV